MKDGIVIGSADGWLPSIDSGAGSELSVDRKQLLAAAILILAVDSRPSCDDICMAAKDVHNSTHRKGTNAEG